MRDNICCVLVGSNCEGVSKDGSHFGADIGLLFTGKVSELLSSWGSVFAVTNNDSAPCVGLGVLETTGRCLSVYGFVHQDTRWGNTHGISNNVTNRLISY